ncbi:hypothetical protein OHA18_13950 [Kribbella sp. NBC_00709]|uniref:hypothetical protein n=1 Tax=Kribbella sp. NBC_00709 TaxID=2975972 RepID=UPI002E28CFF4|nr:hypothetical protein [Kribbella sp. NBC_00709]
MSAATRRSVRTLGALAVAGLLLMPSAPALADDNEPAPTEWPTVAVPDDSDGEAAQPAPAEWPAVTKPGDTSDSSTEPAPAEWPTVEAPQ